MDRRVKFSYEEKLQVALAVIKGKETAGAAARRIGGGETTVQRWVAHYRHHGKAGLRLHKGGYKGSFKIEVIKHMLKNHLSLGQTATLFGIPQSDTVWRWLKKYEQHGGQGLLEETRGRKKMNKPRKPQKHNKKTPDTAEEKLAAMQSELAYLRAENAYLKKLSALIQEEEALKKRSSKGSKPSGN
jgi:Transposase and inactivated derivatives